MMMMMVHGDLFGYSEENDSDLKDPISPRTSCFCFPVGPQSDASIPRLGSQACAAAGGQS